MKLLFLHPNMPGQYKHLCHDFAQDKANTVVFITKRKEVEIPGVHKVLYRPAREASHSTHRYLTGAEKAVLHGQEVWRICKKLKNDEGFTPDVICAHPGWGDALYLKDIYPNTPILSFFEFYYRSAGADVSFDPDDPATEDDRARVRTKNITNILSLESADWGISPTHWQHSVHPQEFQYKISVIHDGVDTDKLTPNPNVKINLPNGKTLTRADKIVTYVARNFEPYRGFPTFMQAAQLIQEAHPDCHLIAIGADEVSYGRKPPHGTTYRKIWLEKVKLDKERIHFVGHLPYDIFIKALQASAAHIYLTYPFVLSWSMIEAMSMECLVIASNTAPVKEVIEHGKNGLLADFFSPQEVAQRVDEVFAHKDRMQDIRREARKTAIARYDLKKLLPLHKGLVTDLAAGNVPPPTHQKIQKLYQ